jgi:hypothetical protein
MAQIKLELETQKPIAEKGDFFYHPKSKELYIVAQVYSCKYCLVCLNSGSRWTDPVENIVGVFGNSWGEFVKVTKPFTVTP